MTLRFMGPIANIPPVPNTKLTADRLAGLKEMIEHNERRMAEQAEALEKMRALVKEIEKTIEDAQSHPPSSSETTSSNVQT